MKVCFKKRKPRLEIIPMIDVMLFLVLFFMVFSTFKVQHTGIDVKLPHAVSAKSLNQDYIVISLTKEGRVYLNEEQINPEELGPRLKHQDTAKRHIVIKPDEEVTYGNLVKVMDVLRKNKIYNTSLAVEQQVDKGGNK